MGRNYIRRAGFSWSEHDMKSAICNVRSSKLSIHKATSLYGIPRSTLQARVLSAKPVRISSKLDGRGRGQDLPTFVEEEMASTLRVMEKWGVGLGKEEFLDIVQTYVTENKLATRFKNNRPGDDWWRGFKNRNNISLKKPERLENSRLIQQSDPFIIYGFYDSLIKTATEMNILHRPEYWFNLDKTSFCHDAGSTKVVGGKGLPSSRITGGNGRENLTVFACISADGQETAPSHNFFSKKHLVDVDSDRWQGH